MFVSARLVLVLPGLLFWLAAGKAEQPSVRVEMGGVRQMRYDDSGKLVAVIRAERATVDDEGTLLMEGINATLHTDDGKQVEVRASRGRADTEGTGDAVFEGDLEVSLSDIVAKTSQAVWRESDRTVSGDEEIVVEGKGSRIVGSGFVAFTSEGKRIIYRPRGRMPLDKGKEDAESKKGGNASTVLHESSRESPRSLLEK